MEDYEVRDVARRLETPDVFLGFHVNESNNMEHGLGPSYTSARVEIFVGNRSPAAAEFALLTWCIDARLKGPTAKADMTIIYKNNKFDVVYYTLEWRGQLRLPIWETIRYQLENTSVCLLKDAGPYYIFWEAQAPQMERKTGELLLHSFGGSFHHRQEFNEWHFEKHVYRKV